MKKSLLLSLFALVAAMAVAATYPASYYTIAPETATVVGDVNCDNVVTASDVTAIYNYLLNGTTTYLSTSDVNGDGNVTASDVTAIYNVLLEGGGSSAAVTSIKMSDYISVTSSGTPAQHEWKNGEDVIFIALDGVEENMYVLVRSGSKWTLKDINGNSKAGFKTSGTIKAAWVRNADYANDQVWSIDVPVDLATGSGSYTRSGTTVAIKLNLTLMESRLDVVNPSQGDYLTNCSHVASITSITENDFYTEPKAPIAHFESYNGDGTMGHAYSILNSYDYYHYLKQGKTGYKASMPYPLVPAKSHYIYSPDDYPPIWTRDFTMCYNDAYDNSKQILQSSGSVIILPVGAEISFLPQEAGVTMWNGVLQSQSNSNPTSVKSYQYSTANTITIEGMEVGAATVSFSYTSPGGGTFNYNFVVKVVPSIWVVGSTLNSSGKKIPSIYFNKKATSAPTMSDVTGDQWIERFEVGMGQGYAWVTNGSKNEIHRSTNPYYSGSYSKRYDTAADSDDAWLYADKSGNVFFLSRSVNGTYTINKNNSVIFNTNFNSAPTLLKADYISQKVALMHNNGFNAYFAQDVTLGTFTSISEGYYLPPTAPNQAHGGSVSFSYQNFAVDHGLAVVKKEKDVATIVGYEVEHSYTRWVDCYLSGATTTSASYNYNTIPTASSNEIFLTDDNQLFYVSDFVNGKITKTSNGWNTTSGYVTSLKNIVMCRYKDGYLYGVRKETGANGVVYYFFYDTFNNVLSGSYTQRVLNLSQNFEIKDIYLETTRN